MKVRFLKIKDELISLDNLCNVFIDSNKDLRFLYVGKQDSCYIKIRDEEEAKRYMDYILKIGNEISES